MNANGQKKREAGVFERFATWVSRKAGSTGAFIGALAIIVVWAATGPFFDYSQTWQLIVNTGTTIITFLMVFLIQKAQNKDGMAIQLKLNELVAAHEKASNRMVSVEDLTQEELEILHRFYARLAARSKEEQNLKQSHSVEEAEELHQIKRKKKSNQ